MPYLFLFVGTIIPLFYVRATNLFLKRNDYQYVFIFFIVIVFSLFYGLRYNVGIDYMTYYNISLFKTYDIPLKNKGEVFEPLFRFIYIIVDFFCLPPNTIFLIGGFVMYVFLFWGIVLYSKNIALSLFIFLGSGLYFFSFNEFRQFIAVCIIFFGYCYCIDRKLFSWCIIVLVAFLYHKSALISFPMYFLCAVNLKRKTINLLAIGTLIIKKLGALELLCTIISYAPGNFSNYAKVLPYMVSEGTSGAIGYIYLVIILIMNNSKYFIREDFKERFFFNLFLVSASFMNIFHNVYMVGRLMEYFSISLLIVFPSFFYLSKKKKCTYIIFLMICTAFCANLIKYALFSPKENLLEYHTVFSKGV